MSVKKRKKLKSIFTRKSLALLLMAIPVFISFVQFSKVVPKNFLFIKWEETVAVSIRPGLVSTLAAIFLYLSIVIRFRRELFSDAYETVICCLNILFCASFLSIFISDEIWNIPLINISSQAFVIIAIVLSWIGMRVIAGFVWIFLFVLAVFRLVEVNVAMGIAGVVYILSAFVSMGLQVKDLSILFTLKDDFIGTARHVSGDITSSVNLAKSVMGAGKVSMPEKLPEK